jgi:hypothetical protein
MDQKTSEWMFYEVMWRAKARGVPYPLPWWVQMYFRKWTDAFDGGLFDSREAAFGSNAFYRYWNMVGVKDAEEESLVGQAGEVEPVYDEYSVSFFLFDPATKQLYFPQNPAPQPDGAPSLQQELEDGYLPVIVTRFRSPLGIDVAEKVLATTVGVDQKSAVLMRFKLTASGAVPRSAWFCIAISPAGPTGFHRYDKARNVTDRCLALLRYVAAENRVEVNSQYGPLFDSAPAMFGTYGNGSSYDPNHYIDNGPYLDLNLRGTLNGLDTAVDYVAGMCSGVFVWPVAFTNTNRDWALDIRLPTDDFRGVADLTELGSASADTLEASNRSFWVNKLDNSGWQASLPPTTAKLWNAARISRANLLILADAGEIHPGPTIYDSFWYRDSSVESVAAALVGDQNLAERQVSYHYPAYFNLNRSQWIGPCRAYGFFGSSHEKDSFEWDSNGEVLWAIGKLDRIFGKTKRFGAGLYAPYVIEGARWIRDNRSSYGLLMSGWSAEHIGASDHPHYWDDFWSIAGVHEAARLAQRLGASEAGELWSIYHDLVTATAASIRWVLAEQRNRGEWETYIPTGPADVGGKNTTMIGALSYFHPCRLYMGSKLGSDIDWAARMTLDTVWHHWASDGGFRHYDAWNCYGPYLTLQLAHAFLLIGDTKRMAKSLDWVMNAGFAQVRRNNQIDSWQVVQGAWNEQHCFPIASDFREFPWGAWYMGDIPHGWACAEMMLLVRDMLFFEASEDDTPHIYLTPGILPEWIEDGRPCSVSHAPTIFGAELDFTVTNAASMKRIEVEIGSAPDQAAFVYPCRIGAVISVTADGSPLQVDGNDVWLPAGTRRATIQYA